VLPCASAADGSAMGPRTRQSWVQPRLNASLGQEPNTKDAVAAVARAIFRQNSTVSRPLPSLLLRLGIKGPLRPTNNQCSSSLGLRVILLTAPPPSWSMCLHYGQRPLKLARRAMVRSDAGLNWNLRWLFVGRGNCGPSVPVRRSSAGSALLTLLFCQKYPHDYHGGGVLRARLTDHAATGELDLSGAVCAARCAAQI